jgi:hypothetical protein
MHYSCIVLFILVMKNNHIFLHINLARCQVPNVRVVLYFLPAGRGHCHEVTKVRQSVSITMSYPFSQWQIASLHATSAMNESLSLTFTSCIPLLPNVQHHSWQQFPNLFQIGFVNGSISAKLTQSNSTPSCCRKFQWLDQFIHKFPRPSDPVKDLGFSPCFQTMPLARPLPGTTNEDQNLDSHLGNHALVLEEHNQNTWHKWITCAALSSSQPISTSIKLMEIYI